MAKYSESRRFYVSNGIHSFGYCIIDKGENKDFPYKKIFHSSNKEQVLERFETIEENHTDFPEPETDWTPQNLLIKTKHHDYSFLIKSPEHLNEVCFKFCVDHHEGKYSSYQRWTISKEYLSIIDDDVINACPDAEIRQRMHEKNKRNKTQQAEYKEHNDVIDLADKIISENIVNKGYRLFEKSEFLYYSFELKFFDNRL